MKKIKNIHYTSTDYENEFIAENHFDITRLPIPCEAYDLIICYHILEHIEDDIAAMKELYRVLKFGCSCIIQTPYKVGEIYENRTIQSPQERLKHFGQKDHVRIYSLKGLIERLKAVGFKTTIKTFKESKENYFGYKEEGSIIIASK